MKTFNYIYLITNKVNGKIYIGKHSTNNLDDGYMGSGILIKKAIQKYGIENFTKEYLAFCDTEEKLNWFEKFYIKKYNAREVGYNLTDGGEGQLGVHRYGSNAAMYGKHHSEETKQKISKSNIGKHLFFTEEHKQKISSALSNRTLSEETRKKISESHKGIHRKGKPLSEETKRKISAAISGKHKVWNKEHTKFRYE